MHVTAPHVVNGKVMGPFHHYCKVHSPDPVIVCLIYDSAEPNARLSQVEYIIAKKITRANVSLKEWNRKWHDHRLEIATGRVQVHDLPEMSGKPGDATPERAEKTSRTGFAPRLRIALRKGAFNGLKCPGREGSRTVSPAAPVSENQPAGDLPRPGEEPLDDQALAFLFEYHEADLLEEFLGFTPVPHEDQEVGEQGIPVKQEAAGQPLRADRDSLHGPLNDAAVRSDAPSSRNPRVSRTAHPEDP